MDMAAQVFSWLCVATGAVVLFAVMLCALGVACIRTLEYLRVWHTLALCLGVQLHGRKYRDDLFWRAIRERAERSNFAAECIASYALEHKPGQPEGK